MQKILYATDGSEGASIAGQFLADLPHASDCHVHIVHVAVPPPKEGLTPNRGKGDVTVAAAAAGFESFPGRVTTAVVPVTSASQVADAIREAASARKVDLIVVGSRGSGSGTAAREPFLGSVAGTIVRSADTPVLVVRPGTTKPLQAVVVGLDGSADADAALRWVARELPLPSRCALLLVLVRDGAPAVASSFFTPALARGARQTVLAASAPRADLRRGSSEQPALSERAEMQRLRAEGDSLARAASAHRGLPTDFVMRQGNPVSQLVEAAKLYNAGLVVVGAHGMSPASRHGRENALGSVAEGVLRRVPCSVLVAGASRTQTKEGG